MRRYSDIKSCSSSWKETKVGAAGSLYNTETWYRQCGSMMIYRFNVDKDAGVGQITSQRDHYIMENDDVVNVYDSPADHQWFTLSGLFATCLQHVQNLIDSYRLSGTTGHPYPWAHGSCPTPSHATAESSYRTSRPFDDVSWKSLWKQGLVGFFSPLFSAVDLVSLGVLPHGLSLHPQLPWRKSMSPALCVIAFCKCLNWMGWTSEPRHNSGSRSKNKAHHNTPTGSNRYR